MSAAAVPGKRSLHCPDCGASVAEDVVRCPYCDATLTRTSCPACFAPAFAGMRFCPACGAALERQVLPPEEKPLACPRCAVALTPALVGAVRIDECAQCGGLWLGAAAVDAIVRNRDEQALILAHETPEPPPGPAAAPARYYVPCAVCGELMQRRNFAGLSGVIVDWCKPHGTWFDRRELQAIVDFIQAGGLIEVRQRELDALKEEERKLKEMKAQQAFSELHGADGMADMPPGAGPMLGGALVAVLRELFGKD